MINLDSIYIATYNIHRFKHSDFKRRAGNLFTLQIREIEHKVPDCETCLQARFTIENFVLYFSDLLAQ